MGLKKIKRKIKEYIDKQKTKQAFKKYAKNNKIMKLQLGSAEMHLDGWFNTDLYYNEQNSIYKLDMLKKFDFEDNTFDYIYSEHNIEHFETGELYKILNECLRVLKPEGVIRIATPDLRKIVRMYWEDDKLYDEYCNWQINTFIPFSREMNLCTKAIVLNNFFRCWGHKAIYDMETLSRIIKDAGFKDITLCETNRSNYKDLNNIEMHWKVTGEKFYELETMIIEAKK